MIIVMGEFRLNPESIEILRNEKKSLQEQIRAADEFKAASGLNSRKGALYRSVKKMPQAGTQETFSFYALNRNDNYSGEFTFTI